ncbi:MAG: type II toxin-antitoxin system VapC family toxin [Flavobacteriales bacterium]|nr:type II toxin-antitoxin system VapC family toxin [Flavobacteriales bacterium]MCC6939246.1 type II toxin-antitoxin system VapC family toxin [Flavobacteriales bacterium]
MRLLADTHVFLWFILDDPRIATTARPLLVSPDHERFISIASVWEVAIKHGLGKLQLTGGMSGFLRDFVKANFHLLDITPGHILELATLPLHHRDPFDRMLIAQASHESMHLLTADPQFEAYDVPLITA